MKVPLYQKMEFDCSVQAVPANVTFSWTFTHTLTRKVGEDLPPIR